MPTPHMQHPSGGSAEIPSFDADYIPISEISSELDISALSDHQIKVVLVSPYSHWIQWVTSRNLTSLASASPPNPPQHCPPDETATLPPHLRPHHSLCPPDMLPTLLTILTLTECPPNTTDPYACVVPSRHTPDTAYHPYAREVPSRHAPETAYHP
ncbi:hypothetical protein O181_045205 [Austropuccinia psidii MF-1]|uniref:Uncharacterized protein n=1 Tax=Austropuccinia psidii MF-1 TaxID=1389203 RepID=A0A9Q3DQY6_9BASI|nr:hypothetical protein [Austropuccinia psidii MF-1]